MFTDQGRNFESRLFTELCRVLQIHKAKTTPYRPSANGQVERFNRTLIEAVRCYIGKAQNKWDEHLPQIAGALRSAVNSSTGYTANRLMLGREVNQPADILYPIPRNTPEGDVDDYCAGLSKAISDAHETARSTLKATQKRMKRNYDVKAHLTGYHVGDLVYMVDSAQKKGKCKKLSPPWKGPGRILKRLSPYLYQVEMKNKTFVANQDRLKACNDRQAPAWCKETRRKQKQDVYCMCRKPDDGQFMIQCDRCDEWYHGRCVEVAQADGMAMDKYYCPKCIGRP